MREIRWINGVKCIKCESKNVIKKGFWKKQQKYECKECGAYFNDLTDTVFAESKLPLRIWFFVAFLMQVGTSTLKISKLAGINYKAAHRMAKMLRKCIYTKRIQKKLRGEVEMDETYVKAGLKGMKVKNRPARKRGSRLR